MSEVKHPELVEIKSKRFNKDALPFVPDLISDHGSGDPNYSDAALDDNKLFDQISDQTSESDSDNSFPTLINFSCIPLDVTQSDFVEFLESEFPNAETHFNLINYQPFRFFDGEANKDIHFHTCLILVNDYQLANDIIDNLHGYEWLDNTLDVKAMPMYMPMNYFYYPMTPMASSPLTPNTPPPFAPNQGFNIPANTYNKSAQSAKTSRSSSFGSLPLPGHILQYPYPQQFIHPQLPHLVNPHGNLRRSASHHGSTTANNTILHAQNLRNSPNLKQSHISSTRSSSLSSNTSNGTAANGNANTQSGIPQFLLNFVEKSKDSTANGLTIHTQNEVPDLNYIIVNDDDGNPIKVNPCRLFIGNIPFSSTWSNLKLFLVSKCEEFEPNNDISILRVEIPMHSNSVNSSQIFKFNSYQNKDLDEINENNETETGGDIGPKEVPEKGQKSDSPSKDPISFPKALSRGFAIVTTGNRESSEKIIKYFDTMEFEGRNLTVRFDKFPEYNNYVLQQLYPQSFKEKNTLTHLAFERNSFQQKFYYGNMFGYDNNYQGQGRSHSFSNISNYPNPNQKNMYYGYNSPNRSSSYSANHSYSQNSHNNQNRSYSNSRNNSNHQSPRFPILPPNFIPQIHPSMKYINTPNGPGKGKRKHEDYDNDASQGVNEDEKARELVNSFKSLDISS